LLEGGERRDRGMVVVIGNVPGRLMRSMMFMKGEG